MQYFESYTECRKRKKNTNIMVFVFHPISSQNQPENNINWSYRSITNHCGKTFPIFRADYKQMNVLHIYIFNFPSSLTFSPPKRCVLSVAANSTQTLKMQNMKALILYQWTLGIKLVHMHWNFPATLICECQAPARLLSLTFIFINILYT